VCSMAGRVGMAVQSSRSLGSLCLSWLLSAQLTTAGWCLLVSLVSKETKFSCFVMFFGFCPCSSC
jgi:hypothetical protein